MATVLIVAPVFALIAAGYLAVLFRFVSETANKGISEFAFSIAIPALLFRTIVVSEFPSVSAFSIWALFTARWRSPGSRRSCFHPCSGRRGKTAPSLRSARSTATS
jgi:hypothetical protein